MNGNKIPLLLHLEAGLARVLQLISDVATATANALTEMQETVDGITAILSATEAPEASGTTYTFDIANLTGGSVTPKAGDVILYSYYRYTVTSVTSTTAVCNNTRVSIRGEAGAQGATGADGKTPSFEIRDGHLYAIFED